MTDATDDPRPDPGPTDPRRSDPTAPERRVAFGGGRFGLFSEVLVVGLGVSVLSLPVVTVLPALAAGAAHVRRHVDGDTDRVVDLWHDFVAALRGVWPYALASLSLLLLLWFNTAVADTGMLPGGTGVVVLSLAVAAMLAIVLLRAAGGWHRGASWRDVIREAGRRAGDDLTGSGLLLVAMALCGVIVWMLAPLSVLVPGLLALAVVAVEHRAAVRRR